MSWSAITELKNAVADNLRQFLVDYSDNLPTFSTEVDGESVEYQLFDNDKWDDPIDPADEDTDSMKDLAEAKADSDITQIVNHIQSNIKTGRASITATTSVEVTGLGFSDTNYSIAFAPSVTAQSFKYASKGVDGFTITASAMTTAVVNWIAIHD